MPQRPAPSDAKRPGIPFRVRCVLKFRQQKAISHKEESHGQPGHGIAALSEPHRETRRQNHFWKIGGVLAALALAALVAIQAFARRNGHVLWSVPTD